MWLPPSGDLGGLYAFSVPARGSRGTGKRGLVPPGQSERGRRMLGEDSQKESSCLDT